MLKIRDEVDLKELEKFGYLENRPYNYLKHLIDKEYYLDTVMIDIDTRIITRHIKEIYSREKCFKKVPLGFIHDLIEAGLVEKVEQ